MSGTESSGRAPKRIIGRPWPKGVSGNPGGRKATPKEVLDYISAHTMASAERLVQIMNGKDPQQARLAAEALLDRAYGRAPQAVDLAIHRGADAGAVGGSPDQARQRLEELIAAAQASATTDGKSVALTEKAQELSQLIDADAEPCPTIATGVPPERGS